MSQFAHHRGLAIGSEYDCELCGGRWRVGRFHCDVGHPDHHCHDHDEELSAPTLADQPRPQSYVETPSGFLVATPYAVTVRQR